MVPGRIWGVDLDALSLYYTVLVCNSATVYGYKDWRVEDYYDDSSVGIF